MTKHLPLLAVLLGVLLFLGGFAYDVFFAGIPYQDPTPAMSAKYALHSRIASGICWLGVAAILVGVVSWFTVRRLLRRRSEG